MILLTDNPVTYQIFAALLWIGFLYLILKFAKKFFKILVLQMHSVEYLKNHPLPDQALQIRQAYLNEKILEDLADSVEEPLFSSMYIALMYNHNEVGMGRRAAKVLIGNGGIKIQKGEYRFRELKGDWDAIGVWDKPNGFGESPMSEITRWALDDSIDPETKEIIVSA